MTFERADDGLVIATVSLGADRQLVHHRDVVVAPSVVEMHDGETIGDWLCRHGRDPDDEGAQRLYVALAREIGARQGIPERYRFAWEEAIA